MMLNRRKTKRAYSFRVRARACVCTAEKKDLDEFPLSSFSLSLSLFISHSRGDACFFFVSLFGTRAAGGAGEKTFRVCGPLSSRACLCVGETARVFLTTRASIGKKKINDGEEGILRDGFER